MFVLHEIHIKTTYAFSKIVKSNNGEVMMYDNNCEEDRSNWMTINELEHGNY